MTNTDHVTDIDISPVPTPWQSLGTWYISSPSTLQIRAWLVRGAELHASKEEKKEFVEHPEVFDDSIDSIIRQEDKDRSGTLEWEEVKDKWTEQILSREEL